jgi:hypothetical protein
MDNGVAARRGRPSPPLWGRVGEGGTTNSGVCGLPPSLTLPHKGGGNGEDKSGHDESECMSLNILPVHPNAFNSPGSA